MVVFVSLLEQDRRSLSRVNEGEEQKWWLENYTGLAVAPAFLRTVRFICLSLVRKADRLNSLRTRDISILSLEGFQ